MQHKCTTITLLWAMSGVFYSFDLYVSVHFRLSLYAAAKKRTNRTLVGHDGHARWLVVYYRCEQLPGTTHLCCGECVCSAFTYIDVV